MENTTIDTSRVEMVRSAKGRDMLCVDNFLYHYDDRGYKSYRWVCNKRKDKLLPCRARLITSLVDEADESVHEVRKIVDEHTHTRCTDTELAKAYERKRLANMAGEPCTLINKSQKRRLLRQKIFEELVLKEEQEGHQSEDDDEASSEPHADDDDDEDGQQKNDESYLEEVLDEWDTCEAGSNADEADAGDPSAIDGEQEHEEEHVDEVSLRPMTTSFVKGAIQMLRMPNEGRELLSLDGHLYRCDGRTKNGVTFRWQCLRHRLACKAHIYTDLSADGTSHTQKILLPAEKHSHAPYTPGRLNSVIQENRLTVIEKQKQPSSSQRSRGVTMTLIQMQDDSVATRQNNTTMPFVKRLSFKPRATDIDYSYELCENPLEVINATKGESAEISLASDGHSPIKKFTFLPSAKGNQVLCLDNYIYHYDSRSNSNGHAYWTCHLRRHKLYKCNGRVITKQTEDGPRILKVSGTHKHPFNLQDIQSRLYKGVVAQKASDPTLKPSEILNTTMAELGLDFKRVVAKSRESIERRIGRLRHKMRESNLQSLAAAEEGWSEETANISYSSSASECEAPADDVDDNEDDEECSQPAREETAVSEFEVRLMQEEEDTYDDMDVDDIIEEVAPDDDDVDCDEVELNDDSNVIVDSQPEEEEFLAEDLPVATREPNLEETQDHRDFDIASPQPSSVEMDISKVSTLRSAKGGELLCVDGFIYHVKCSQKNFTYWTCIKRKDPAFKCPSRVSTSSTPTGWAVEKVTNQHTHPAYEQDIKRRLYNELAQKSPELSLSTKQLLQKPLHELTGESSPRKRSYAADDTDVDMDITQVSILRSAKGGELLCVDGFIYHVKSVQKSRTYWACIKCKDRQFRCQSRVSTISTPTGWQIIKVTNQHTHPVYVQDIKRRLCNELTKQSPGLSAKAKELLQKPLHELSEDYAVLLANAKSARQRQHAAAAVAPTEMPSEPVAAVVEEEEEVADEAIADESADEPVFLYEFSEALDEMPTMKLYGVSDGPPSLAVRMTFKALNLPFELVNVDYVAAQHLTEEYAKMNPQKEIPVLDDDGFYLSESIAIMQYLCEKYAPDSPLYPTDPTARAIVNHRLCFNMGFYYSTISAHVMAPIFFDYQRTDMSLKKLNNALSVFETYLQRAGTKYAAGPELTIADFALASATLCLEAIKFDLSAYPLVQKWYETFKQENGDIWSVAQEGMNEIAEFEQNPPDLSHMNHPFHPTRPAKA